MRKIDAHDYADYEDDRAARIQEHAERIALENPPQPKVTITARFDRVKFENEWQASKSFADACERLGLSPHLCSGRAFRLRKAGVRLKKFAPGIGHK